MSNQETIDELAGYQVKTFHGKRYNTISVSVCLRNGPDGDDDSAETVWPFFPRRKWVRGPVERLTTDELRQLVGLLRKLNGAD